MLGRTNTGGGGGGLNYTVVGGTSAPSNPKENTIWVNTSTAITSHVFSATQPTGSAGMVWIQIGVESGVEFNALKKNGIQVYPITAKQHVSGAWVDKTAKSYQGGKWAEWVTYLFNGGNQNVSLTGGLKGYNYKASTSGAGNLNQVVTFTDVITMTVDGGASAGTLFTEKQIDLTNYKKMAIELKSFNAQPNQVHMLATKNKSNKYAVDAAVTMNGVGAYELDISALSGNFYCAITLDGDGLKTVSFDKWRLLS